MSGSSLSSSKVSSCRSVVCCAHVGYCWLRCPDHNSTVTGVGLVGSAIIHTGVVAKVRAVSTEKYWTGGDRSNIGRAFLKVSTCLV